MTDNRSWAHKVGMVLLTAFVMATHPIATIRAAWRAYVHKGNST